MSVLKRKSGRLAVLTGAALVVPLAVGATVVTAETDGAGAAPFPAAASRAASTESGVGPATSPGAGHGAGGADAGAPEAAAVGDRRPSPAPGRAAAPEQAGGLAEAAGREPPASHAKGSQSRGLEQAAGKELGDGEGARGRAGEARDRTQGLTRRADVAPDTVHDADIAPGGCLAEYGEDGQCLPTIPPSLAEHVQDMEKAGLDVGSMPHHWDCAEVRTFFADGIAVRQEGTDPQGLDADKDGVACGAGD